MTTAIIGTGGLGSVIARQLASGGETLRLSSADKQSARTLAAQIGPAAVVADGNRDALQGAGAVILALRFTVLKSVIDEIAGPLAGKVVIVPSNPLTADAHGNVSRVLPKGQSSGKVVAGWLPAGAHLAMAFGTMSAGLFESASHRSPEPAVLFYATDDDRAGEEVERLIRTAGFEPVKAGGIDQSSRLEVGGDLHDLVVGPAEARSLTGGDGPDRLAGLRGRAVAPGRGAARGRSRRSRATSPPEVAEGVQRYNAQAAVPVAARTQAEVCGFFAGLELIEPGIVQVHRWRPGTGDLGGGRNLAIYAGVGRKP